MKRNRLGAAVGVASLVIAGALAALAPNASATVPAESPPSSSAMVSEVPSTATPAVNNGDVRSIAKVGTMMVMGGTFTQVGGSSRAYLATFNQANGALSSVNFNMDGPVYAVHPGPTSTTAYVGGDFSTINGVARRDVALVNISTGQVVSSWVPPQTNFGFVNDIVVRGTRVFIGGTFTQIGGKNHSELATLAVSTGALDPFMDVQMTGHHNDSGSGAQGWPGVVALDITPDGSRMVAAGNFKYADGEIRDQVVQIDLSGSKAAVLGTWATSRLDDLCFSWAFDSWVRDVSFSPDGQFFVISGTGGGVRNSLCDAASRFETDATSTDAQPTWVSESGGDTNWANAITSNAVFVGGHQRWANNPTGVDYAGPGAVARPGIVALDPVSGRPLAWNPGRNPAGVAVYALLATSDGLYMGSNNEWIGNRRYSRPRIAFFPYSGDTLHTTTTGKLPGRIYLGGSSGGTTNVLYRVNAGGAAVTSSDAGPDWTDDSASGSDFRNSNSNAAAYDSNRTIDSTVPPTTPGTVFDSERWSSNDNPAMEWAFPVPAGTPLQVRLYFANRCSCTSTAGQRQFNVKLDGTNVLTNYDISGSVGDQKGTMKSYDINSDGSVNIDFSHGAKENPLINAIEIVRTDVTPTPATDGLSSVPLGASGASTAAARPETAGSVSWANSRGAFMVGSTVFYGSTDGFLHRVEYNGSAFSGDSQVNPYHDPKWANVSDNLGGTYDGQVPSLYGQMSNVTGMTYSAGWMYYTLANDSRLLARWFSPDSGIMDERVRTVASSVNFADANGMFVNGGKLFYALKADGSLNSVDFDGTSISGSATKVSGAGIDGVNWKNRSMFLYAGPTPNEPPTANAAGSCVDLTCTFTGTGTDSDGSIASYSWAFGDGGTASSATADHTYGAAGTYTATLTVKDNDGATTNATKSVTVTAPTPNQLPTAAFDANCSDGECSFDGSGSSDPDGNIATYAWDFGDGGSATGASPTHQYLTSGEYSVVLKVTDNKGASDSESQTVQVTAPAGAHPLGFVGATNSSPGSAKFKAAVVPAGTEAGDQLLLWLTTPTSVSWTGPSGVTGWTVVETFTNSTVKSTLWTKTAAATDAGKTVRVDDPSGYRLGTLAVAAYRNVDASAIAVTTVGDSSTMNHKSPTAAAATGDWVVSYWAEKSSSTTSWTNPSGETRRGESSSDPGAYRFSYLLTDSGGPVQAGQVGGLTAKTDATSDKSAMWTVVLHPVS